VEGDWPVSAKASHLLGLHGNEAVDELERQQRTAKMAVHEEKKELTQRAQSLRKIKERSSHPQADAFAGSKAEKKIGPLVRNDGGSWAGLRGLENRVTTGLEGKKSRCLSGMRPTGGCILGIIWGRKNWCGYKMILRMNAFTSLRIGMR